MAFGTVAQADRPGPDRITMPLATNHLNSAARHRMNETNPGLALTWDAAPLDVTVGVVRNSFSEPAPFITLSRDFWRGETCRAAAFIGTAHYPSLRNRTSYDIKGWIPLGGLHLECGFAFVQIMPGSSFMDKAPNDSHADAILVFGLTFDLSD
ncbi:MULTISPECIES: hypothetical protein [unclassified Yoonia]|uniref:hypothetical protein n=1 Tax=unclassified Yoonia TaxID=2629118 RepID=UPI002AFE11FF|nr:MULTISPECIES: hypothetical protein [unclassified Yoonia]